MALTPQSKTKNEMFYLTEHEAEYLQRQAEALIDKAKFYEFENNNKSQIAQIVVHPHNVEENKYYASIIPTNGAMELLNNFCQNNSISL